MKLLPKHAAILAELYHLTRPNGEMCVGFNPIVKRLEMQRSDVRRIVRHLARKGLAEYWRGLWSDDGQVAGAGYCVTEAGQSALQEQSR